MPNITYRQTSTPTIPGSTSTKGSALTNEEVDANFKALDNDVTTLNNALTTLATNDLAIAYAIALGG